MAHKRIMKSWTTIQPRFSTVRWSFSREIAAGCCPDFVEFWLEVIFSSTLCTEPGSRRTTTHYSIRPLGNRTIGTCQDSCPSSKLEVMVFWPQSSDGPPGSRAAAVKLTYNAHLGQVERSTALKFPSQKRYICFRRSAARI